MMRLPLLIQGLLTLEPGRVPAEVKFGCKLTALTRYRDTQPAQTVAFLEKNCLPELFWQAPA